MTAIRVENLSKRYVLRHNFDRRDGLRHSLEAAFRAPLKWLKARKTEASQSREDFWALKDVSFEIQQGDAVAIIGRNGAGKSTLLKILSRITEPTQGRINLKGRVASLLEVGTGFHQELTGRENIFLNGAILGMSRAEIKSRFDEIVAFSEVEKFLDTPVKRYSSGMYVRLAFAVAAHLEPEILIVDEVLAVGDAAFQKKCLGRMGQVAKGGRTVLFVSHNMPAVQALCSRAIHLHKGAVVAAGAMKPVVDSYIRDAAGENQPLAQFPIQLGTSLTLGGCKLAPNPVRARDALDFRVSLTANRAVTLTGLSMLLDTVESTRVALVDLRPLGMPRRIEAGETWHVRGRIKSLPLVEGEYRVSLTVDAGEAFFENVPDVCGLTVSALESRHGYAPYPAEYRGIVDLDFEAIPTRQNDTAVDLLTASPVGIAPR